jgi:hypothetical protein
MHAGSLIMPGATLRARPRQVVSLPAIKPPAWLHV